MNTSVSYAELTPQAFRARLLESPIAYLPLGTLEWHGEHLPLGADGLQAQGFFTYLARQVGGIVLPMLFLGPDGKVDQDGQEYYGMDKNGARSDWASPPYPIQQLTGSAYWVPDATFTLILDSIMKQLVRAGFRIVVAHGHGPSGTAYGKRIPVWKAEYGVECFHCWGEEPEPGVGIQVDHAAMNETSLMMALHPELVHMEYLPTDMNEWPLGIAGGDPRIHASAEFGHRCIRVQGERMIDLLREALVRTIQKR